MRISILALMLSTASVYAYDLPEIICYIQGTPIDTTRFGRDFCWVGDQNDDGYDDLLINHDPFSNTWRSYFKANQVKLFHGGDQMDDEPDLIFGVEGDHNSIGWRCTYIGHLIEDRESFICIQMDSLEDVGYRAFRQSLYLYEGNEELDTIPEFAFGRPWIDAHHTGYGHRSYPADINGDGYDDIVSIVRMADDYCHILVYHGGEEFDSTPDQFAHLVAPGNDNLASSYDLSTGYDLNNDGYDDIIVQSRYNFYPDEEGGVRYALFLGGEEMDTSHVFRLNGRSFENKDMREGFAMLPDINNDGYDDWGGYWVGAGGYVDGYFIFFGSDEPDAEPDLELEGNVGILSHDGDICGGDFNGDGYNDIATGLGGGYHNDGEVNIYFGSPWIDGDVDIRINGEEDYGDEFNRLGRIVGAVGDYNGDGIDDFVARAARDDWGRAAIVIFAGNRDWRVDVPIESIPDSHDILVKAFPNPFNSRTSLYYRIPVDGEVRLRVYDISGRLIETIVERQAQKGQYRINWSTDTAGIYLTTIEVVGAGNKFYTATKMVCIP